MSDKPSETDFADLTYYISLELPVKCGDKFGIVYTYSHKDHLKNSLLKNYTKELARLIETKKYCDSALCSFDVGPTIAIANLIDDGEYAEFVKRFNHGDIQLSGLEHVLKVKEKWKNNWYTHYMMPKSDEMKFQQSEQMGVVQFALIQKYLIERKKINNVSKERLEFLLSNDKEFPTIFRKEILEKAKIDRFDAPYSRIYTNCIIYENLFEKILEKFEFKLEDVETADSLTRIANYQGTHMI